MDIPLMDKLVAMTLSEFTSIWYVKCNHEANSRNRKQHMLST